MAGLKKPYAENPRSRYLNEEELERFWTGINETTNISPPMRIALKLLMVTGQRRVEVAHMSKAELNLPERTSVINHRILACLVNQFDVLHIVAGAWNVRILVALELPQIVELLVVKYSDQWGIMLRLGTPIGTAKVHFFAGMQN